MNKGNSLRTFLLIKKVLFIAVVTIVMSLLHSCERNVRKNKLKNKITLKLDTLKILISNNESVFYGISSVFDDKFHGYNFNTKTIDVFSLSEKKILNKIPQGIGDAPSEVDALQSMIVYDDNKTLLISPNGFYFKTGSNPIDKRILFADRSDEFSQANSPKSQFVDLFLKRKENDFIFLNSYYNFSSRLSKPFEYYKNAYPFIKYYPKQDSIATLNIDYPEEYLTRFYGDRNYMSLDTYNDTIFYNFASIPKIFKKHSSGYTSVIDIPTDDIPGYVKTDVPLNSNDNMDLLLKLNATLPYFGKIHKVGKYLVCIYKEGTLDPKINPFNNDRLKTYALIFENDIFLQAVEVFPKPATTLPSFVYNKSVLIQIGAVNNEETLNFLELKLNDEN